MEQNFYRQKNSNQSDYDCRKTSAKRFRTRIGFSQYNAILTKEQSVLTRIINLFEGENTQVKYNDLGCSIDLYFHDYKLAIKIDKNGHSHRIIDSEIKRQRAIE